MPTTSALKRTAAAGIVTVAAVLSIAFSATPSQAAPVHHPVPSNGCPLNHPCFT